MKTHVANTGPRINPLSPNRMFGVPDLESMDPHEVSTTVISLGCALRVDFGETTVKSHQAHEASDLTPVKFSRT